MFNVFKKNEKPDDIYSRIVHLYSKVDENSISHQALNNIENLKFAESKVISSEPIPYNTTELTILSKMYHEQPKISDDFVPNMNSFLENITQNYDKDFQIDHLIGFLEGIPSTLYFEFTYAISKKQIVFPQNEKILIALSSYWIENTTNLALLNFSLIFDALIVGSHENQRNTQIAIELIRYPQTVLSASYYLINCYINDKPKFNEILLSEIKTNKNIHVRTFLLHFLTFDLTSIKSEDKIYLLINAKKLFNILSQYKVNSIFLSVNPEEFLSTELTNEDIISIFETLHILAIDGPKSGLTLNESTVELIDKLFDEIINREKTGEIFFPIFYYKPFLSLLNFFKDHVGVNLEESKKVFTQQLLNKIYDKFKIREEKIANIDLYTPEIFNHKFRVTSDNIEIHMFEDSEGKILTVYPLIKSPVIGDTESEN